MKWVQIDLVGLHVHDVSRLGICVSYNMKFCLTSITKVAHWAQVLFLPCQYIPMLDCKNVERGRKKCYPQRTVRLVVPMDHLNIFQLSLWARCSGRIALNYTVIDVIGMLSARKISCCRNLPHKPRQLLQFNGCMFTVGRLHRRGRERVWETCGQHHVVMRAVDPQREKVNNSAKR